MTRRDLLWRGIGAGLFVSGCCGAVFLPEDDLDMHGALSLLCMGLALLGLILAVQGKKVALALRIETSPHRMLPQMIRLRRRERRARRR